LGEDTQVISGESGAGGFAGFIALMKDPRFREIKESLNINAKTRLLFFSTEGDTDPKSFRTIIGEI
jgi:diaminopropionate ammonia-lyase